MRQTITLTRKVQPMYASDYAFDPDNDSTSAGTGTATPECPESIRLTPIEQPPAADDANQADPRDIGLPMIVELLLKDRRRLFRILRVPSAPAVLMPRLLAIALMGFVLFGVTMSLVLSVADVWPSLTAIATWIDAPSSVPLSFEAIDSQWGGLAPWIGGDAFVLVAAYAFGLVAASGVCLPSLYFYSPVGRRADDDVGCRRARRQIEGGVRGDASRHLADLRRGRHGGGDL